MDNCLNYKIYRKQTSTNERQCLAKIHWTCTDFVFLGNWDQQNFWGWYRPRSPVENTRKMAPGQSHSEAREGIPNMKSHLENVLLLSFFYLNVILFNTMNFNINMREHSQCVNIVICLVVTTQNWFDLHWLDCTPICSMWAADLEAESLLCTCQ